MRQEGFSLLEILVAFSILALSLGVLMEIFSGATRNADLARDRTRATELARSLMASTAAEPVLLPSDNRGTTGDAFHWQVQVEPYREEGVELRSSVIPLSALDTWQIKVRVAWGGDSGTPERLVTLATLRVRPRELK